MHGELREGVPSLQLYMHTLTNGRFFMLKSEELFSTMFQNPK
jgi:hypothetical protein